MLEFHTSPNSPWYARQLADGSFEFNPAVPNAEQLLAEAHPTMVAAVKAERKLRRAIRKARLVLRRARIAVPADVRDEIDEAIDEFNDVEPDVAE